jgi:hypothetical protein
MISRRILSGGRLPWMAGACGALAGAALLAGSCASPMPGSADSVAVPRPVTSLDLPARTWVPRPLDTKVGPVPGGAKHSRVFFDSRRGRMVLAGGDVRHPTIGNGNGNPTIWTVDLERNTPWERIHDWCSERGELMPGTPDTVGWVYASRHDQGVMFPGFYFITQDTRWCPESREVADALLYDFATSKWLPVPFPKPANGWGGDIGASYAAYDPETDSIYRFRNGGTIEVFSMSGTTRTYPSGPFDEGGNRDQAAIDVRGRSIYRVGRGSRSLIKMSIRSKSISAVALPRQWVQPANDMETYLAFDPINRVLLLPNVESFGGKVLGLGIYHVDTKRWEWEAAGTVQGLLVRGNVFGFDEKNNAFLLLGGHTSEGTLPPVTVYWLYRYK